MISSRTAILISIAVIIALVAAVVFFRRSDPSLAEIDRELAEAKRAAIADEARTTFATFQLRPVKELESLQDAREIISRITFSPGHRVASDRERRLLELASEFVYYRFILDDPEQYRMWRYSLGDRLADVDFLIDDERIDSTYAEFTGKSLDPSWSMSEVFDEFWRIGRTVKGGGVRCTGIAAESDGLHCAFGRLTEQSPRFRQFESSLPADLWHGNAGVSGNFWVKSQLYPYRQWIKEYGGVDYAHVGFILEFANKFRRPVVITFVWDYDRSDWRLEYLTQSHIWYTGGALVIF